MSDIDDGPPDDLWDETFAQSLIGAKVLVGLTYLTRDGVLDRQEQFVGTVARADQTEGVALALGVPREGETYWLPPQTSILQPAQPGVYRLRSTGEDVVDPDYLVSWTVTAGQGS